ncbi:MAG TPA: hypothetical protein VNW97_00820 [Candidatus Saccharimonadales bacterium]|nr:hypothetical protein [Candidatus Saccharimonadales bacterium]
MGKPKFVLALVLVLASAPSSSQTARGAKGPIDIAVIVNASNPLNDVSASDLRKMLMGDRRFWKGNVQVKLVLREPGARERDQILTYLLKLSNREFAEQWRAKVFRGEAAEEPLSVFSDTVAQEYLRNTPGGITFLATKKLLPELKVLKLEGKLPGESGYALK